MTEASPVRDLTFDERRKWGTCPVCKAEHGVACSPDVGLHLGSVVHGTAAEGVHLGRLQNAPRRVREVPA